LVRRPRRRRRGRGDRCRRGPDPPDLAGQLWTNDDEICDNGIDDDGNSDQRASWSNHSPGVTVYAPGSHIYSTLHGGTYGFMSGTSMAAPNVA
jgi:subtilisin family serine protease